MSITPNSSNYTLGRGRLLFNRKNTDGSYQGMRDLGNCTNLGVSISVDKTEHYSSRSGLRTKDKSVITGMNPTLSFTLDEINAENLAMTFMASIKTVSQSEDDDKSKALTSVAAGYYYELDESFCGVNQISHGTVTGGPFQVGETVTGGTSSATAVVTRVDAAKLCLKTISGTFVTAEVLTGGTSAATATSSSAVVFNEADAVVSTGGTTYYTAGTDYTLEPRSGKIFVMADSTIPASTAVTVEFGVKAISYKKLSAFDESSVEGELHFVSDVAVGNNQQLKIWSVQITPSGDASFITDQDWNSLDFEGEIEKDESGHPLFPYMQAIVE